MPRHVSRGSHSAKRLKVVDEVGLVIVAALNGHRSPVHLLRLSCCQALDDALKSQHAVELLRLHPDTLVEQVDEVLLADSDLGRQVADKHSHGQTDHLLDSKMYGSIRI